MTAAPYIALAVYAVLAAIFFAASLRLVKGAWLMIVAIVIAIPMGLLVVAWALVTLWEAWT